MPAKGLRTLYAMKVAAAASTNLHITECHPEDVIGLHNVSGNTPTLPHTTGLSPPMEDSRQRVAVLYLLPR